MPHLAQVPLPVGDNGDIRILRFESLPDIVELSKAEAIRKAPGPVECQQLAERKEGKVTVYSAYELQERRGRQAKLSHGLVRRPGLVHRRAACQ